MGQVDPPSERGILITGAAGFIGSHIAEEVSKNPSNRVVLVDDLSAGREENLQWMDNRENCRMVRLSILEEPRLSKEMSDIDIVFHEAAMASVKECVSNPTKCTRINVEGTASCLEACRKNDVKTFVLASSCAVYGDLKPPLRETGQVRPLSPYAASKVAAEALCQSYHRLYGIKTVSLRYFNVYGPRQPAGGSYSAVIPSFISKLASGRRPVIYGDGSQVRDFVFIQDVVAANLLAASGGSPGQCYNIGGGRPTSVLDLLDMIRTQMGARLQPVFAEPRKGDIRESWADLSLARRKLGYEPRWTLQRGIASTISSFVRSTDSKAVS